MECLIGASGLGDWWIYTIETVNSQEDSSYLAWSLACEQYESYVGNNGIQSTSEIIEEYNCSEEEAEEIFIDNREAFIEYWETFDIENKIDELLKEGSIDSVNDINNYDKWKNQE